MIEMSQLDRVVAACDRITVYKRKAWPVDFPPPPMPLPRKPYMVPAMLEIPLMYQINGLSLAAQDMIIQRSMSYKDMIEMKAMR